MRVWKFPHAGSRQVAGQARRLRDLNAMRRNAEEADAKREVERAGGEGKGRVCKTQSSPVRSPVPTIAHAAVNRPLKNLEPK